MPHFPYTVLSILEDKSAGPEGLACSLAEYTLHAELTANGPGTVHYQWTEADLGDFGSGDLTFDSAGTLPIEQVLEGPFDVPFTFQVTLTTDQPDKVWGTLQFACDSD